MGVVLAFVAVSFPVYQLTRQIKVKAQMLKEGRPPARPYILEVQQQQAAAKVAAHAAATPVQAAVPAPATPATAPVGAGGAAAE
jgi:hypothetical protein